MQVTLALLALLIELAAGYPKWLYRMISHPVVWIGFLIGFLDRQLNRETNGPAIQLLNGVLALVILLGITGGLALAIGEAGKRLEFGSIVIALVSAAFLAQRSLASHVDAVAGALDTGGIQAGREAVGMIVGRDTAALDESGVSRAAIESLAENFSDGVVAPAFWLAVSGLPGIVLYKAINTADSMIGHKSDRYRHFGWAAARLDDLVNLPASRLTAVFVIAAAAFLPDMSARSALRSVARDARRHRSPNAGWPEAAFAGALGLELAGPRQYGGAMVRDAVMGEGGRKKAVSGDIRRAIRLFWTADLLMIATAGVLACVILALS